RESSRSSRSCGRPTPARRRWCGGSAWSGSARRRNTTTSACRSSGCAPGIWPDRSAAGPGCDDVCVSDALQVTGNQAESRFELRVDGLLAELPYRRNGKRLVLIHTEVPEELEGRGLGGALVTAAVDRAAREGLTVVPLCPFARGWLQRHPDVAGRAT